MSSPLKRHGFFTEACIARLRRFLDEMVVVRRSVGDQKQSISFSISPHHDSVEFRYRGQSARLDCLSPYVFPDTEKALADVVGDDIAAIRVTGNALSAAANAANAMTLISGSYEEIQTLCDRCQFKSYEKAMVAFPIYHGWSKAKIEVTARHYAPFPIERIDFDRHRFALLDSLSERMDDDWVLCVMEAPDSGQISGKWMVTFPGGKRMLGESSFACCLRELREEIGLLSDEEEIENSPPISAALEDKFCAFVLHPKHFVVGGRDHNLDETNLYAPYNPI